MPEDKALRLQGYQRIKALGEEQVRKINNDLQRGVAAMAVARMIQQEWKDFQDVGEKTLTQQLNRYRSSLVKQTGLDITGPDGKLEIKYLRGSSIKVLEELEMLAKVQTRRLQMMVTKEQEMGMAIGATGTIITDYQKLLEIVQKVRFDLGIDKYSGPLGVRGVQSETVSPDGTIHRTTVMEAVQTADQILTQAGIPRLVKPYDADN
jgi:uncharacterized protein YqgV (UPF0045/DUF77 family)